MGALNSVKLYNYQKLLQLQLMKQKCNLLEKELTDVLQFLLKDKRRFTKGIKYLNHKAALNLLNVTKKRKNKILTNKLIKKYKTSDKILTKRGVAGPRGLPWRQTRPLPVTNDR